MAKVTYPSTGLKELTREKLDEAKSKLNEASKISVRAPGNFSQAGYLNTFSGKVNEYLSKHISIKESMTKTDNSYNNLNNEIESNFNKKDNIKITEREKIL